MADAPPHVLLVEKDLFFAGRILSVLKKAGCRTRAIRTPAEALEAAERETPDLVMLNLASPELGGTNLIRDLKALSQPPRVLAYLSHVKIPAVREEVLAAGADKLCANSAVSLRLPGIVRDVLAGAGPREED